MEEVPEPRSMTTVCLSPGVADTPVAVEALPVPVPRQKLKGADSLLL